MASRKGLFMVTEQQVRGTINCCLATLDRYHDAERLSRSKAMMAAEVAVAVGWVSEWGISLGDAAELIARPVEWRLLSRYGHEIGTRLDAEFTEAFELALAEARQPEFAARHGHLVDPGRHGPSNGDDERAKTSSWT
ncbi:hypothetical protein ACYOEI_01930 [Singulisphaera rosea]